MKVKGALKYILMGVMAILSYAIATSNRRVSAAVVKTDVEPVSSSDFNRWNTHGRPTFKPCARLVGAVRFNQSNISLAVDFRLKVPADLAHKVELESIGALPSKGIKKATNSARTFMLETVATLRVKRDAGEEANQGRTDAEIAQLIEILVREPRSNLSREYWRPEMKALVSIGSPTVPSLIELIQSAHKIASLRVSRRLRRYGDRRRSPREIIESETDKIQTRAVMVLGAIGDRSALPTLKRVLGGSKSRLLIYYTKNAIRQILDKPGTMVN